MAITDGAEIRQRKAGRPRKIDDQTIAEMWKLYSGGMTLHEIGRKYGAGWQNVWSGFKRNKYALRGTGRRFMESPTQRDIQILKSLKTKRMIEVARAFGMHKQQVFQIKKRWAEWSKKNL